MHLRPDCLPELGEPPSLTEKGPRCSGPQCARGVGITTHFFGLWPLSRTRGHAVRPPNRLRCVAAWGRHTPAARQKSYPVVRSAMRRALFRLSFPFLPDSPCGPGGAPGLRPLARRAPFEFGFKIWLRFVRSVWLSLYWDMSERPRLQSRRFSRGLDQHDSSLVSRAEGSSSAPGAFLTPCQLRGAPNVRFKNFRIEDMSLTEMGTRVSAVRSLRGVVLRCGVALMRDTPGEGHATWSSEKCFCNVK